MDAGVCILDEGPCVTIEVDGLRGVEKHVLPRIDLQDEVFQRTETYFSGYFIGFFFRYALQSIYLVLGNLLGVFDHLIHQIIGINYRSFTGFHLAVRQFDHAVGEMNELFAEWETKAVEKDREYFEVVLLFVTNDINHLETILSMG